MLMSRSLCCEKNFQLRHFVRLYEQSEMVGDRCHVDAVDAGRGEIWDHAVQHIAQAVRKSDPMPRGTRKDLLVGT